MKIQSDPDDNSLLKSAICQRTKDAIQTSVVLVFFDRGTSHPEPR